MKKHLVLLSAVLLVQTAVVSVFAQQKPNAGDLHSKSPMPVILSPGLLLIASVL